LLDSLLQEILVVWVLPSTALVASHAALIDRALSVSPSFCSRRAKKSEK